MRSPLCTLVLGCLFLLAVARVAPKPVLADSDAIRLLAYCTSCTSLQSGLVVSVPITDGMLVGNVAVAVLSACGVSPLPQPWTVEGIKIFMNGAGLAFANASDTARVMHESDTVCVQLPSEADSISDRAAAWKDLAPGPSVGVPIRVLVMCPNKQLIVMPVYSSDTSMLLDVWSEASARCSLPVQPFALVTSSNTVFAYPSSETTPSQGLFADGDMLCTAGSCPGSEGNEMQIE